MSQQAVTEFLKRIDDDAPFRDEFFKAVSTQLSNAGSTQLSNGAPIVEFAGLHGFTFTEQELQQAAATVAGPDALSDSQIEAVAGGVLGGLPGDQSSRLILRSFASPGKLFGDIKK